MSVEPFHLFRYLDEQIFRYNNRKERHRERCGSIQAGPIADCGKAVNLRGGDWQGDGNAVLILCVGSAGSGRPLPPLSSFLGIKFGLDFRVRHCNKPLHKIREFAEIALNILPGVRRASWLLWHDRRSVQCRAPKVNPIPHFGILSDRCCYVTTLLAHGCLSEWQLS